MCDTLYAGPSAVTGGRAWFAKNSDRHPTEPQALCLVPRREPSQETVVGSKAFPIADKGFAYALSKPSWIAGGEAGVNERGLAIGNEAVFSRWKAAKDGILGMDILRAALASCGTANEALDFIKCYIEEHDQGGNGAYRGSLYYDNSFIISGFDGAFVLETAGRRWAWRAIDGIENISNAYCIDTDYKRLDTQTRKEIAPVNERAACSDEADPGRKGQKESWKAHVENRLYLRFTRGEDRRAAIRSALETAREDIGLPAVFGALRSHGTWDHSKTTHMVSPCVHEGGFPVNNATTASLAFEYRGETSPTAGILWFTGTSYPCISLYKPILLAKGAFVALWTDYSYGENEAEAYAYWTRQRDWIKETRAGELSLDTEFAARRDEYQMALVQIAEHAAAAPENEKSLAECRAELGAKVVDWHRSLKQ